MPPHAARRPAKLTPPPPPLLPSLHVQPEAVRSVIDAVLAQPLDALGDALQGFTWEFEPKASGRERMWYAGMRSVVDTSCALVAGRATKRPA